MRHIRFLFSAMMGIAMLLAACAPQATPTLAPTAPATATQAPTEAPTLVPAPTEAPPTPTLVPINLAGPEMTVGSKYLYVDGSTLVAVPAGEFVMGRGGSDNPQHTVTLSDFWIYSTKVTNQQYAWCVKTGNCTPPNTDDNPSYLDPARLNSPVTGVNWDQANAYCTFVHGRLPTEAEWEKTARGPDGNIYPWGDAAPSCALLNFNNCIGKTTNVTLYPNGVSYYSALDMEGNAFEWVADWYDPVYYKASPTQDPLGPETGQRRSIRSTGYKSNADQTAAAVRFYDSPGVQRRDLSFRCVIEEPAYFAPYCQTVVYYGLDGSGNPTTSGGKDLDCPSPVINHNGDCGPNKTPVSNITVHVDAPSIISVLTGMDTCNPATNTADETHVCPIGVTIHVEATCSLEPSGAPSCPAGYTLSGDGTSCISKGGPGVCPTGYQYDQAAQCCSAVPGKDASIPLCAAGFHYYQGACVADINGLIPPVPADWTTIVEKTCGGGTQNGCNVDPSSCGDNAPIFCKSTCSCISRTQKCP